MLINQSAYQSVCLSISMLINQYVNKSVCLSISLSINRRSINT